MNITAQIETLSKAITQAETAEKVALEKLTQCQDATKELRKKMKKLQQLEKQAEEILKGEDADDPDKEK